MKQLLMVLVVVLALSYGCFQPDTKDDQLDRIQVQDEINQADMIEDSLAEIEDIEAELDTAELDELDKELRVLEDLEFE